MNSLHASQSFPAETVAIVGVGLIGGSIAAALKQRGFGGTIVGVGRSADRLEQALRAELIDEVSTDLAAAAARSQLLIFCTPVDRIAGGVRTAAPHCAPGTLITDAGSVKGAICGELAGAIAAGTAFIGSHPLAGSEKTGFEHADADLFVDRLCVVTPDDTTPADGLQRLVGFWQSLGMQVRQMSASDHDRALAQTSHLPHVVSAALAAVLSPENRPLTATGFADTTRIAAGDPDLWTAILLANSSAMTGSLADYVRQLNEFQTAIANRDAPLLKNLLEQAKRNRGGTMNDE